MEKWRMIIALTVMVMTMAVQSFTGTEMVGLSVIKSEYSDKNQNNNIRIFYPQIQGLGDEIREETESPVGKSGGAFCCCWKCVRGYEGDRAIQGVMDFPVNQSLLLSLTKIF